MEMTTSLYYFLLVLHEPLHGYQIMQEVEKISGGKIVMGAGTCYGLITRCLDDKLIKLLKVEKRKKIYIITKSGKETFDLELNKLENQLSLTQNYLRGKHV